MAEREWFREWFDSPFYHKLYFEREEQEARVFIGRLADRLRLEAGSLVLDVGCGRGRQSRIMASMGFDVTGIDLSPASIEFAKQSETDNLHFFVHDIRLPFWGNYFDHAFILFSGFGYFRTRREHEAAIRTIARSLKPGGTLTIDYLNVHYAEDHLLPGVTKHYNGTVYDIQKWDDELHFYKKVRISDASLTSPHEFTEKISKFSPGDFNDMLSYQGMQVEEIFGDYDLRAYDVRKTPRMIVHARKRDAKPADKEKRLYSDGRSTDALT
jgi:SAM-dependent methyltransferase